MIQGRFLVGLPLSIIGGVLFFFAQTSAESWQVDAFCDDPNGSVSGTITAETGSHEIEVFVTYHIPADGEWHRVTGASQILNVEGTGPHSFGPLDVTATPPEANAIRVEIIVTGHPTNEKSDSFKPCRGVRAQPSTSTPTPTKTAIKTPTSIAAQPTSTSMPAPTNTSTLAATSTATSTPTSVTVQPSSTPRPTNTAVPTSTSSVTGLSPTPTLISEVGGTVTVATPTTAPAIPTLSPPTSGDGGLLTQHRTSFTLLGIGLIVLGVGLIAFRGITDVRDA